MSRSQRQPAITSALHELSFSVNGVLQRSDVSAPYSCNWKVPNPANRTYQIQARALDGAGNSATAAIQVTSR